MSKLTSSFLILVLVIFFSSVVYIWQADSEQRNLQGQVLSQKEQISYLETQLNNLDSPSNDINVGKVQGAAITATGNISGAVLLSKDSKNEAILVCAIENTTKQETCIDFIIESDKDSYDYEFDIPNGTYQVYAMIPPSKTKVYYIQETTCDDDTDCEPTLVGNKLIEVLQEETQSDIDISF